MIKIATYVTSGELFLFPNTLCQAMNVKRKETVSGRSGMQSFFLRRKEDVTTIVSQDQ